MGFDQGRAGVTLHLADGSEERGSALIGADGINSAIRGRLLRSVRPRYAGYQSLLRLAPFRDDALIAEPQDHDARTLLDASGMVL